MVHLGLVIVPRDSCVPGWRPLVCYINPMVLVSLDEPDNSKDANTMLCLAAGSADVEASILLDSALV